MGRNLGKGSRGPRRPGTKSLLGLLGRILGSPASVSRSLHSLSVEGMFTGTDPQLVLGLELLQANGADLKDTRGGERRQSAAGKHSFCTYKLHGYLRTSQNTLPEKNLPLGDALGQFLSSSQCSPWPYLCLGGKKRAIWLLMPARVHCGERAIPPSTTGKANASFAINPLF